MFGTVTEKAVKAFQEANHLTDDGIAGRDTFSKLFLY
ncbi:peptidoglycan-binding protein [Bacillus sp. ISL-57]|nr:peptidoglycan-binding protein [Bacillus sp. ISL-57]